MGINSWFINQQTLLGGLEHFFIFPYLGNSRPIWLILFRGVETTNQFLYDAYVVNVWTKDDHIQV